MEPKIEESDEIAELKLRCQKREDQLLELA